MDSIIENDFKLMLTKLDEIQNHEDFTIVLFPSNIHIPNEENMVDYLKKFDSLEVFNNYIKEIQSERKILLVLTNFFGRLPYFNHLSQIHSIYILNKSSQNMENKKQTYSKLVNTFTNEHALVERLRRDILLTYRNDLSISISSVSDMTIEQSLTNLDDTALMFMWNQAFIYYLVNSPLTYADMNKLKEEMVDQCRLEYKNDKAEEPKINDFANNCTYDTVLEWYTKDSCIYRLVNKAFRTRNINLICKFRYFSVLLYKKLNELCQNQQGENYKTIYRGQKIKLNDLENLKSNIGNLTSMNTPISTTRNQNVARIYLKKNEVNVIFEINLRNTTDDIHYPFADIARFSSFPEEEEVLLFAGAVFRIDSVEPENNSIWIVKLTMTNETLLLTKQLVSLIDTQLTILINKQLTSKSYWDCICMKTDDLHLMGKYYVILTGKKYSFKEILTNTTGINVFYLLSNLGNYENVIEYYKKLLLDRNFMDHSKFIVLNILIAYNYFHLFKYDNALIHYGTAFSLLDGNNKLTGELYNHLGDVWKATFSFDNALSCYDEALKILTSHYVKDHHIARIYRKIADLYQMQNKYDIAITYEDKANQLDAPFREPSELDNDKLLRKYQNQLNIQVDLQPHERADILYSMGICLMKKHDYPKALDKLLEAKILFEDHVPSYDCFDKKFGRLFDSIAWVYLRLNDTFNALLMWKRAIDIRKNFPRK